MPAYLYEEVMLITLKVGGLHINHLIIMRNGTKKPTTWLGIPAGHPICEFGLGVSHLTQTQTPWETCGLE